MMLYCLWTLEFKIKTKTNFRVQMTLKQGIQMIFLYSLKEIPAYFSPFYMGKLLKVCVRK